MLLCFAVVGSTQVLTSLPLVRTDSALLALPCAIAATVLYYLAFARNIESSSYWTRVRQVFLPLAFLPFLLLLIGGPRLGMCAAILGEVASRFLLLSVYVGMFDVCRKSYVKAGEALAVVHVSFYAGLLIGSSATSSALTSALPGGAEAMPLVALVAFLCLVCALCWLGTDGQAEKLWGRGIDLTPRSKTEARTTERCQAIAHLFDLTQKEYEVLRRLVERKQAGQVADELCVSKNTVRTHMRNIYTKLDVHTQDDLLKFYNDFTMP